MITSTVLMQSFCKDSLSEYEGWALAFSFIGVQIFRPPKYMLQEQNCLPWADSGS